ncbi:MAG: hypothetical protein R3F40_15685 [Candidatus Competibacteraceae bacterium]
MAACWTPAIAGLLPSGDSVMDYLEGVGPENHTKVRAYAVHRRTHHRRHRQRSHQERAVLSVRGPNGFKKSFRHELLVPEYALLDPDPLATCPVAADSRQRHGRPDATTESYVSIKANPSPMHWRKVA